MKSIAPMLWIPPPVFFMDAIGYLYTLLGEWERGTELIMKAIEYNPFHRHFVYYALWLKWFRQEKYEEAFHETREFSHVRGIFGDPLTQAATLGHLGRISEGKIKASKLLKLNPHISTRGRVLMKNYMKSEDILRSCDCRSAQSRSNYTVIEICRAFDRF